MPIDFPTRQEVIDRSKTDVQTELPELAPFVRNSVISAMITANAGRAYEFYQQLQAMLVQAFPDTATGEYLQRWGSYVGISPLPASAAFGKVVFTGTPDTTIPINTQITYNNFTYLTQYEGIIAPSDQAVLSLSWQAGVVTALFTNKQPFATGQTIIISGATPSAYNGSFIITVTSDYSFTYTLTSNPGASPATGSILASASISAIDVMCQSTGLATNAYSGAILNLASSISGIANNVYASFDGVVGGSDAETTEAFRSRLLYNYQNPVAQYNVSEITLKAQTVSGVTRVWVESPDTTTRSITPSSVTSSGNGIAILTTSVSHGLISGDYITVSGMSNPNFNMSSVSVLVLSPTELVYIIATGVNVTLTGEGLLKASTVEPGQIKVFFVRDFNLSIIPSPDDVLLVKNRILEIKPAHVTDDDVIVLAPVAQPIDFEFASLTPNTPSMKIAIKNTLYEYFRSQNVPSETVTLASLYGALYNTVDTTTGQPLTEFVLAQPSMDVPVAYGSIATLGMVAFDE